MVAWAASTKLRIRSSLARPRETDHIQIATSIHNSDSPAHAGGVGSHRFKYKGVHYFATPWLISPGHHWLDTGSSGRRKRNPASAAFDGRNVGAGGSNDPLCDRRFSTVAKPAALVDDLCRAAGRRRNGIIVHRVDRARYRSRWYLSDQRLQCKRPGIAVRRRLN